MIPKTKEKQKSIKLRKKGLSYNEILRLVPVAKSTLSLWLRHIGLAKRQKQRLTKKRRKAQLKAQQACRDKRIQITGKIKSQARKEINKISKRELWLIGIALYWAEGSKQKESDISGRVSFGNSDPEMIKLYLKWLKEMCHINSNDIEVRLYIHKKADIKKAKEFWSSVTKIPVHKFEKTVLKKHRVRTNRRINKNYYGLVSITVKKSTNFNREIAGWIEGVVQNI